MALICDVCHAEINSSAINNEESPPSINLFPCFHKHCLRCKCAANQQNGRFACKVCGCQCLHKHIYDYAEPQLERIYCMFCNIKNRAPVEWRCETCQKSYLCNVCTKPHSVSGHTLTPVKPYVPTHSQCHSHLNLTATYLCSCQMRLCINCLNIHANGQLVAPHEQRYPFAQLADQARQRIQTIRTNSQREVDRTQKILPVLQRNKKFVHEMASKARSAVADQVVELCNALIRRGNDIVTHIDLFEQEKLQKYEVVENEMKRVADHFKKIEEFSENALVTAQNDNPGMFSASEFAQNSVNLISKKLDALQQDIELTQRLPKISYQSDITSLVHSIQRLGVVDVDGHKTVPLLTTPPNAQMFTVTNGPIPPPHPTPSVVPATTIRPSLSSLNPPSGGATIRQGPPLLRPPNQNLGQSVVANVSISAVPTNPFNVPLPPNVGIVQPTQQQQHQLVNNGRIMNSSQVPPVHHLTSTSSTPVTGILSHLLQQGVHTTASTANNSLPNSPTTPCFPHICQPHPQVATVPQHQVIQQQQQQQHQLALHQQQQMVQMQRQVLLRSQMIGQQQQHHHQQRQQQQQQQFLQSQQHLSQQQQQQSQNQTANIHQNQILLKQMQAQQQLFQLQQQQQQRQFIEHHQQQQPIEHHQQQQPAGNVPSSSHNQIIPQNSNVSTAAEHEKRLLLRFPNPFRQQTQQQPIINQTSSCSPIVMSHNQMASPSQTHQVVQQHREPNITNPDQQQQSALRPLQPHPIIVDLMDDEEEEAQNTKKPMPPQSPNEGCSFMPAQHEQQTQVNHPQVSPLKAQSAAADSTVNAGNGSSDDSSASPCPSTSSVPKRPSAPPIAVSEPSLKRLAMENSHTVVGINRIAIDTDTEEGFTRSPLVSTTMGPGDDASLVRVMDGSANDQTEMPRHKHIQLDQNHQEKDAANVVGNDHCFEAQQSTSKKGQNSELNDATSPPETDDGKLQGDDRWDDYCYVCSQGCDETTGSLGCCETCPRVFHAKCHVPMIPVAMEDLPDDWRCTLCLPCDPLTQISHSFGKLEKLLCSKVFLACFVDFSQVELFLNAVSSDETDYYAVIKEPIWLNKIAGKISSDEYKLISEFVDDMNLLFRNCSTFNLPTNPLSTSGKKVYTSYMKAMREFLPAYEKQIWIYVSLYSARLSSINDEESVRRRCNRRGVGQKAKSQTPQAD